jgi:allophanate hydrolase
MELVDAHRGGRTPPEDTIRRNYQRIRDHTDATIFITLRDEAEALSDARPLSARDKTAMPLFGVPVAVKDNIDVAGLPTTAACPAFSYIPCRRAFPLGVPRNPHRADLIPEGSHSGSAIAPPSLQDTPGAL